MVALASCASAGGADVWRIDAVVGVFGIFVLLVLLVLLVFFCFLGFVQQAVGRKAGGAAVPSDVPAPSFSW